MLYKLSVIIVNPLRIEHQLVKIVDVLLNDVGDVLELRQLMAIMVRKHAAGADDGVAEFAEVFDFLLLVLEAEDFAAVRNLVYLGWVHAACRVHRIERANCRRFVDIHHALPLVQCVTHGLRSRAVRRLPHRAHAISHHMIRWLLTGRCARSRHSAHQLPKNLHNFVIGRQRLVAVFLILLGAALWAHAALAACRSLLLHAFGANRVKAFRKQLGNSIELIELFHAMIAIHCLSMNKNF